MCIRDSHLVEHSSETARVNREEGGDDVKSSCPLCLGLHTCYNGRYNEMQYREVEQNYKTGLSSDCRLKLAYMKLELLVIADQNAAVNAFPGLVHTARPVSYTHLWIYRNDIFRRFPSYAGRKSRFKILQSRRRN